MLICCVCVSQGISDYVPADIDVVGYRVYLGNGQYFVESDVGEGKTQWWVLLAECKLSFNRLGLHAQCCIDPPAGVVGPPARAASFVLLTAVCCAVECTSSCLLACCLAVQPGGLPALKQASPW